jgi:hypothetical protein
MAHRLQYSSVGAFVIRKDQAMDAIAEKMTKAGSGHAPMKSKPGGKERSERRHAPAPKKGDQYRCEKCGMAIKVTADCPCEDGDHVHLQCCDREMQKV